jgi:hypothetical protein
MFMVNKTLARCSPPPSTSLPISLRRTMTEALRRMANPDKDENPVPNCNFRTRTNLTVGPPILMILQGRFHATDGILSENYESRDFPPNPMT